MQMKELLSGNATGTIGVNGQRQTARGILSECGMHTTKLSRWGIFPQHEAFRQLVPYDLHDCQRDHSPIKECAVMKAMSVATPF